MSPAIWTIYDHPTDYPDVFVARKFYLDQPTDEILTDTTLDGLRRKLPPNLTWFKRDPMDDPKIVECWF